MRWILFAALATILCPQFCLAQDPAPENGAWTRQQKQAWLYERLVAPVQNPQLVRSYTEKLAGMSNAQLDATIVSYQQQLLYRQQLLQQQLLQQQRFMNNGNVGFRPILTWLPTGTNFTASGVVSPDRRYVRMSLNPFFSSIPRVDTFNYHTGQSRNIYRSTPGFTQSTQAPRTPQLRRGNEWYQKIRTLR